MRKLFASILLDRAKINNNIILITADLGFGLFDDFRKELPHQFYNVGAAETCAMGIAVGLALENKIPFVYSITPFLLWRAAETIRNYVNYESVPVKMIGSGRDDDYKHDGFSHWAGDDEGLMKLFPNIKHLRPYSNVQIKYVVEEMIEENKPFYLNLKR